MAITIQRVDHPDAPLLRLCGTLDATAAVMFLREVTPLLQKHKQVTLDLSSVELADSAGIAALAEGVVLAQRHGSRLLTTGASAQLRDVLARAPAPAATPSRPLDRPATLEKLGDRLVKIARDAVAFLQLLADTAYWCLVAPFKRYLPPVGATAHQALRIGVDALPIVCLNTLLLGMIIAFLAAYQLRQFGANIYVANLVGVAMVRELGPVMSAILVAGRSGSAIAAELGTMVVGEEIDALKTMGINEIRFLVVPRVYAITFTQPALTLFANTLGVFGGYLIAVLYLDLSSAAYIQQTIRALTINDLITGLSKSVVFAWIIALVGCYCGLRITGGAEGVGRATTMSVVASIFAIIVADSIFAILITVL